MDHRGSDGSPGSSGLPIDFIQLSGDSLEKQFRKWKFFIYNSSPFDYAVNGIHVSPGRLVGPLEGFTIIEVDSYAIFWWTKPQDAYYIPPFIKVSSIIMSFIQFTKITKSSSKRRISNSSDVIDTTDSVPKRLRLDHEILLKTEDPSRDFESKWESLQSLAVKSTTTLEHHQAN